MKMLRELTGQFVSASDCSHALMLSNGSVYDAIELLANKNIPNLYHLLKNECENNYYSSCNRAEFFVYKRLRIDAGQRDRYGKVVYKRPSLEFEELIPTCKECFHKMEDDPNMIVTYDQFKRLYNGEAFETVCPEIIAAQVIES